MYDKIVVGVDGSESSRRALEFAVEEAGRRGAAITALCAYRSASFYAGIGGMGYYMPPPAGKLEAEAMHRLLEAVSELETDVVVDSVVVDASAAHALLKAGEEADLIVVGTRGHGGFAGLLLGSTSLQVVTHAPCPVVVVPAD